MRTLCAHDSAQASCRCDTRVSSPRTKAPSSICFAPGGIRTPNPLVRSQVLYPLSYGRKGARRRRAWCGLSTARQSRVRLCRKPRARAGKRAQHSTAAAFFQTRYTGRMLGLCRKHCLLLASLAVVVTLLLGQVPALTHLSLAGSLCTVHWFGWPFGYVSGAPACLGTWSQLANYFGNGLLNVLLFFFLLRFGHNRLMHRRARNQLTGERRA